MSRVGLTEPTQAAFPEPADRLTEAEASRREQVVVDDVVVVAPGDQVIADGTVLTAADLRLDESILTGESEAVARAVGELVRSGAFVVEGTGAFRVTAVGEDSFATRITGEARSFRHPRSPLERAVNRLLYALVALVVVLGAVLGYSLYHRHVTVDTAVATSAAGVVTMIPEGLMVLVLQRRGVLEKHVGHREHRSAPGRLGRETADAAPPVPPKPRIDQRQILTKHRRPTTPGTLAHRQHGRPTTIEDKPLSPLQQYRPLTPAPRERHRKIKSRDDPDRSRGRRRRDDQMADTMLAHQLRRAAQRLSRSDKHRT